MSFFNSSAPSSILMLILCALYRSRPLRHRLFSAEIRRKSSPTQPASVAMVENGKAQASNFPSCTIEPNVGIVAVPDPRLQVLSNLCKSQRSVPANMEFVDIAGLVKGTSQGEGLGNKFLSHIREVDSILQNTRETAFSIRKMSLVKTKRYLEDVLAHKQAIPFRRFCRGVVARDSVGSKQVQEVMILVGVASFLLFVQVQIVDGRTALLR